MCETFSQGIEHPNQDTWLQGYSQRLDDSRRKALAERYADTAQSVLKLGELYEAIDHATMTNYSHRAVHEQMNCARLGIPGDTELTYAYDELTGRQKKVGDFVQWFSTVSHAKFGAQEHLALERRFGHVSLELGGIRQFGDWESTGQLDQMSEAIPSQLLATNSKIEMTLYGAHKNGRLVDERINYVDDVKKSYTLLPQYKMQDSADKKMSVAALEDEDLHTSGAIDFDYTMVRRRRLFADIHIPGQSDVVIFKESIGLLIMAMVDNNIREALIDDCRSIFHAARVTGNVEQVGQVKLHDTAGAKLAGALFEIAIKGEKGETKDVVPISAHYVQGVGEKFALFVPNSKAKRPQDIVEFATG